MQRNKYRCLVVQDDQPREIKKIKTDSVAASVAIKLRKAFNYQARMCKKANLKFEWMTDAGSSDFASFETWLMEEIVKRNKQALYLKKGKLCCSISRINKQEGFVSSNIDIQPIIIADGDEDEVSEDEEEGIEKEKEIAEE